MKRSHNKMAWALSAIPKIQRMISPDLGLTPSAIDLLCSHAETFAVLARRVCQESREGPSQLAPAINKAIGEELGKYALLEAVRVVTKGLPESNLSISVDEFLKEFPTEDQRELAIMVAITEYLIGEVIDLSGSASKDDRSSAIKSEHVDSAIAGDEALRGIFGGEEGGGGGGDDKCACDRWRDDFDPEDHVGFGPCAYLRWQTVRDGEIADTDSFPLERFSCGFWPKGTDHSAHDPARAKAVAREATILASLAKRCRYEVSDVDAEFSAFSLLTDSDSTQIPREPSELGRYLAGRLHLDARHASAVPLPAVPGYEKRLLSAFVSDECPGEDSFSVRLKEFKDPFFFQGGDDGGDKGLNTYPVIFGAFNETGDVVGVYAIRVDT